MRKDLTKTMGRKWRCEQTVGGPRGPPCPFPAVWPCEAVCTGFPAQVASLPHLTPENALSRPVWRVCGGDRENAGPPGGRTGREKKKVLDKERGSRSVPRSVHTVPQCGSGQRFAGICAGGQCGGTFSASGVKFVPAWPELPADTGFLRVPGGGTA